MGIADALSMEDVLPRMAEAAASGVGAVASRVQLFLPGGETRSATWPPGASVERFGHQMSVTHLGDTLGALAVAKAPNDPLTPAEQGLLADLASQAGIAMRNAQLAAELQVRLDQISAQAAELKLSRERIVATQAAERRRVERDLHDRAQQRLVSVALLLRMANNRIPASADAQVGPILAEASAQLERAYKELRDLARGIHPAVLVDGGLRPAIESLAERSPLPVQFCVPPERFSPAVEAAAYFVASEALTNVAKYARAGKATVTVVRGNGTLTVEVTDDGVGGADPGRGSGLRGLLDRVAVLEGDMQVTSPAGGGTRIVAVLPCE